MSRIDGSIHDDRPAFLSAAHHGLALERPVFVADRIRESGTVVIELSDHGRVSLYLHTEDQARALIEAAGKAAAMFAAAKVSTL